MKNRLSQRITLFVFPKGLLFFLLWLLFVSPPLTAQPQECFLIMVGPEASATGQVLLAHNNDLTGSEASMLVRVPAEEEMHYLPDDALSFGPACEMLILQTNKGFAEGDAAAINEYGVAIAGGLSMKDDRSSRARRADPLVKEGLGGGVRYFALQHARTARECVEIIGACYDHYGISYPSGVGIGDSREMWYLESGGGHSWAAMRLPANSYFVGANSYRIEMVDLADTLNYKWSPNLPELARETGYGRNGSFRFADFFGGGRKERTGDNRYNTLRLWRAITLLTSTWHPSPGEEHFFPFLVPEKKITLEKCFEVLRDHYQNTPYDLFALANRTHPPRAIADKHCVHTDVITLTPGEPVSYGAVLWTGLSTPYSAVYVPVYFGIDEIPPGYDTAPDHFVNMSAFWIYKKLTDLSYDNYPRLMRKWTEQRKAFEQKEIRLQPAIIRQAGAIAGKDPEKLREYLGRQTRQFAFEAIRMTSEQIYHLQEKEKPSGTK
jgi:dipeptidase